MASLVAQLLKNLPALQETACNIEDLGSIREPGSSPWGYLKPAQPLGFATKLAAQVEREMATHASIPARRIP